MQEEELSFNEWLNETNKEHPFCWTLYNTALELKPKVIVDLGVYTAYSTTIFLVVAEKFDGKVYSVDIREPIEGIKRLNKLPFVNKDRWIFHLGDDIEWGKTWNGDIDVLFIDSSHEYEHTLKELELFSPYVKGMILLHDTRNTNTGVARAINEFVSKHSSWEFIELLPHDKWGLGELQRCIQKI